MTRRTKKGIAALFAVSLVLSACSSDDSSDTTAAPAETEAPATEAPATEAPATEAAATEAPATEAAAETEAAAPADPMAEAKSIVEKYSQRPTAVTNDTPITAPIPTGKKLFFISCGVPACEAEIPMVKQATDILGWELTAISTDGSPEKIGAAWDRVVAEKPDGVLYTATAQSQVATQMKAAAANGTIISGCCVTDAPNADGPAFVTSTKEQTGELGQVMAAWTAVDMNGTPSDVVYLDLPDFQILSALATEYEANLKKYCPECGYKKLDIALADLGKASDTVVSYLRANPKTKYVITSTDGAFSLPAAFEAAGLKDIRLFGEGPTSATLADIEAGRQAGTMAFGFYEIIFSMVDAVARKAAGQEIIPYTPPNWILTKGQIPTTTDVFPLATDTVDQWKKIWGK